jgi:hypothetical protein
LGGELLEESTAFASAVAGVKAIAATRAGGASSTAAARRSTPR